MDLDDVPGGDGGSSGYTLCSSPERRVHAEDTYAIGIAYDMGLRDDYIDIDELPACAECLRVAELLKDPRTASRLRLHLRPRRPDVATGYTGDQIRSVLRTDIATGASAGRRAAVHLLGFTSIPDQPGFGGLVGLLDLPWDMGDTVLMGQVTDWSAVVAFATTNDVPDRDRKLIALAASLHDEQPIDLATALGHGDDRAAFRRAIEAVMIAAGQGDRWELTERPPTERPRRARA
ncbi:hypothetical protein [Actinoplanes sichuanensis]|uniref:hypothetical protein n=1 Tax=Actinoplanes sichuanensis TaxID=512349 RepID=UPI002954F9A5|nr:hypothetical protein [Actinoplanes sichuanensis]